MMPRIYDPACPDTITATEPHVFTPGSFPVPPHVNTILDLRNQLSAARYYVHKLRRKMYGEAVARGEICADEAQHHYDLSMANYADVMYAAKNGSLTEANARQMAEDNERGF